MRTIRRFRGRLLRVAMNRAAATGLGLSLLAPAVWLLVQEFPWESAITDGLGLIIGATGAALVFAGVGGRRPDWIE
jgi:hypothetical protein